MPPCAGRRAGSARSGSGTARSGCALAPRMDAGRAVSVEARRPPCAARGRRRATRAAGRDGARGTSRPSTRRGRAARRSRAFTSLVGEPRELVPVEVARARARSRTRPCGARTRLATSSSSRAAASRSARGECPGVLGPHAEPLDQPVADRERGEERDLLRRDRGHERLERVRGERRTQPVQLPDEPARAPGRPARTRRSRRGRTAAPSSA